LPRGFALSLSRVKRLSLPGTRWNPLHLHRASRALGSPSCSIGIDRSRAILADRMSDPADRDAPPPLAEAVGGALGIAESVLPAAAFVATYTAAGQQTRPGLIVAVALGVVFAIARVVRGQTPQFALVGLVGIAISAYVVSRTGRAEDFFLPGLLANAGYALAYAISIAVRWPLLGIIVELASNRGMQWRNDPARVRAYSRASWIWVGLFSLRLAVQLPLYLAGAIVALGVARAAMGVPLFAGGIWLSWLSLRTPQ
jgi:hypothetical protein